MEIPENVKYIIDELYAHGFEAFAVGGCVRDSILHRVPGDWDITTSARPLDVKRIFRRTIDTGIEHGTVKSPRIVLMVIMWITDIRRGLNLQQAWRRI